MFEELSEQEQFSLWILLRVARLKTEYQRAYAIAMLVPLPVIEAAARHFSTCPDCQALCQRFDLPDDQGNEAEGGSLQVSEPLPEWMQKVIKEVDEEQRLAKMAGPDHPFNQLEEVAYYLKVATSMLRQVEIFHRHLQALAQGGPE